MGVTDLQKIGFVYSWVNKNYFSDLYKVPSSICKSQKTRCKNYEDFAEMFKFNESKEKMQEIINKYLSAKRALFDKVYGRRLNPEQRKAVFTVDGPLLVLAGAYLMYWKASGDSYLGAAVSFFNSSVSVGTVYAGFGKRTAHFADFVGG